MSHPSPLPPTASAHYQVLRTEPSYDEAQRLVDRLSDAGFPVEHVRLVGTDLRLVEQVTGRMTYGKAALYGAASGAWLGLLIGLLLGLFTVVGWLSVILWAVLLGAVWGLIFGLLGAVVGYLMGHYAYELVKPMLAALGWLDRIDAQVAQLREITAQSPWKAFWLLVIAGFTPIPLKIFTWASGIVGVPFLPFMASMAIGRGKRLYLVALAIRLGGERAEKALHKYIEPIGWFALLLLAAIIGWLLLRGHGA